MDDLPQLRHFYKTFKNIADEAGSFFRQKEHYSISEQIDFLLALYKSYMAIELCFESDEELREGKSVTIQAHGDFARTTLDFKHLKDEFETTISIVYFNLSKDDIEGYLNHCKNNSMMQETLIIKRMFERFFA